MDFSKPVKLSVSKLREDFSFENNIIWWRDCKNKIKMEEVFSLKVDKLPKSSKSRKSHIRKISYFRDNLNSKENPISVELDRNPLGWPIADGNHRLAAAIVRGDSFIWANLGGYFSEFNKFYKKYGYRK